MAELKNLVLEKVLDILSGKIRANIYGYVKDDAVHVAITKNDHEWECTVDNVPELAALGCPAERIANKIIDEYRKEVMKRYFF